MMKPDRISNKHIAIIYAVCMCAMVVLTTMADSIWVTIAVIVVMILLSVILVLALNKLDASAKKKADLELLNQLSMQEEQLVKYRTAVVNTLNTWDKRPVLTMDKPVSEDLGRVAAFLDTFVTEEQKKEYAYFYKRLYAAIASQDNLKAFRDNHVRPLLERLRTSEMPLSDADSHAYLVEIFRISMLAIDLADISEPSINNRPEQLLSIDLIKNTKSYDDICREAIEITDNPLKTPIWVRALKKVAQNCNIQDEEILYSGYVIKK